jgi:hypothetical protein
MKWLRAHPFERHTIAFLMMMAPTLPIYLATNRDNYTLAGLLLVIILLGNLLELAIE